MDEAPHDLKIPEFNPDLQYLGEPQFDEKNKEWFYPVIDYTPDQLVFIKSNLVEFNKLITVKKSLERQVVATFQEVTDQKEADKSKELAPPYDPEFDYLKVLKDYKVTRILKNEKGDLELVLFFLIQPHTPVNDPSFLPENAPALWSKVVIGADGYEAWTQPKGGDGKYKWSAVVTHNGRIWRNDYDPANTKDPNSEAWLNVWIPGEFHGWTDIGSAS